MGLAPPTSEVSIPSRATTALRRLKEMRGGSWDTSFNPFQGNYCFETHHARAQRRGGVCFNPFQGNYCFETLSLVDSGGNITLVSIPSRATTALRQHHLPARDHLLREVSIPSRATTALRRALGSA